jgi:predicted KAP-like P-loop ATPase
MHIEAALKNLDRPIQSIEEDLLQRSGFVENLCRIFETALPDESAVFALYGEWGSGKTSVKNLLIKELSNRGEKSPIAIDFNPWAFSGQDQVLEAFFSEIGKSIGGKPNGEKVAEEFKKLGAYLSYGAKAVKTIHVGLDLFGIPGSKIVGMVGEQLESGSKNAKAYSEDLSDVSPISLEDVQKDLKDALAKLKRPVLIILDDLDRLAPDQLLTIFQIVKQNANLPGVNYLLLMDIETIAKRLEQKGLGAEFIEKIVQFDLALPHVSSEDLKNILKEGFKAVMGKYEGQINWERWEESWINGGQNLFTTLRRIKRFLHTLKFSIKFFANNDVLEVDPVDLFLIESVRKFAPNTYALIPRDFRDSVIFEDTITRVIRLGEPGSKGEVGKKKLAELVSASPENHRQSIERILTLLFPQINDVFIDEVREQALRDSRICNQLSFDSYFRMAILFQTVTLQEMVNLFGSLDDTAKFRGLIMTLYKKTGLIDLFHLIYCHRQRFNAKYLATLLGELWWLEDFDVLKDGEERNWSTREQSQDITRIFLREYGTKANRCEIVETALNRSKTYYPIAYMWCREHQILEKSPDTLGMTFDKQELEALRPIILKEIHEAVSDGRLLRTPDMNWILRFWMNIENKNAVQIWVDEQRKDNAKLITILKSLIVKTTISGYQGMKFRYSISQYNLKQYFDPIEDLEPVLSQIDKGRLPRWEKFAVEETLQRIDNKKKGVKDADIWGDEL